MLMLSLERFPGSNFAVPEIACSKHGNGFQQLIVELFSCSQQHR